MKLVVGLGNPGETYQHNRHNVGFMFADYLLAQMDTILPVAWKKDAYLLSLIAKPMAGITLAKPETFMNKSGEAVRKLMENGKFNVDNLLVIHDDLDIPLGKFRIVNGYGPKLHNGIESIENHLHSKDFLRVRIGVDNRTAENRIPGIDYVLQNFLAEERESIDLLFPTILNLLQEQHNFPKIHN